MASVWSRLREGLQRSRSQLVAAVESAFGRKGSWAEQLEALEEALILADMGAGPAAEVVAALRAAPPAGAGASPEALRRALAALLASQLEAAGPRELQLHHPPTPPAVALMVGVNGSGKTTTAGKLAWQLHQEKRRVLLVGADTFRAAAQEQLAVWAERAGAQMLQAMPGQDPAAVTFDGIAAARNRGQDVVIVDTAGRLHNKSQLMAELTKVGRVAERALGRRPDEVLLVIDATTGQNGLAQARLFTEAVGVTGLVLTKLDGTARGGIAVAIARELRLPIKLIGVGEAPEALRPFDPQAFAHALLDVEPQ